MLDSLLENLNYINVMILMAVESSFIPFPSEVVVPPAAYMAAEGKMSFSLVLLFATFGSLIGATINYFLALFVGRPIVYKFAGSKFGRMCLLNEEKIMQAEKYFDKHGAIATLIGRLVPAVRQLISIPAGLARMNFGYFTLYTIIGAGFWNVVLACIGWYLHSIVPLNELNQQVEIYERPIIITICALVIVGLAYYLYKVFKKN
ncbi:MAG: DedA family protein [Prevotellaceae bacterium]|nr:DedA family protein [Candidatus Faecinaster equi]